MILFVNQILELIFIYSMFDGILEMCIFA